MMRRTLIAVCIGALLHTALCAADPAKDPGGWNALKFGMSPDQVVAALGPASYVADLKPEPRPFRLDETIDLPAAFGYAAEVVAKSKKGDDTIAPGIVDTCKALLALSRPASWRYDAKSFDSSLPLFDPRNVRRVTATLESITSWGGKGTAAYSRTLHVRNGTKITDISESVLDDKSAKRLREIEDAVENLAAAIQRDARLKNIAAKHEPQPIDPARIRVHETEVRGITLQPELTFAGNNLSRIKLSREYAGENDQNFDELGMHRTLCDALAAKYGPADEENKNDNGWEYVWKFPTTVIRCTAGHRSYTGRLFARDWVFIVYEVPDAAPADTKDNL